MIGATIIQREVQKQKALENVKYVNLASEKFRDEQALGPSGIFGFPIWRRDVHPNYIVEIHSQGLNRTVRALLQENFSTTISSSWGIPTLGGFVQNNLQDFLMMHNVVLGNPIMTRRKWQGSSAMRLSLRLFFDAIEDAQNEVVMAAGTLLQLAAPAKFSSVYPTLYTKMSNLIDKFTMVPPGPNIYRNIVNNEWFKAFEGDVIDIHIGNFITFSSVIITGVEVVWGKKFTNMGIPTTANALVSFETFEMYMKETLYQEIMKAKGGKITLQEVAESKQLSDWMENQDIKEQVEALKNSGEMAK